MLTIDDESTIRFAIERRLDKEPGVRVLEVVIKDFPPSAEDGGCIAVGVLAELSKMLLTRSRFDLPREFEHIHLVNEIDEICEQMKAAKKDFWGKGRVIGSPEVQMRGSGLRGRWRKH